MAPGYLDMAVAIIVSQGNVHQDDMMCKPEVRQCLRSMQTNYKLLDCILNLADYLVVY